MLDLFIINDDYFPIVNPEILTISIFKEIVERDKSKVKTIAIKELAYIFWESNYQSPFRNYEIAKVRLDSIKKDINLNENWNPDELVLEGVKKYKQLQATASMKFLDTAEKALNNLREYLDDANLKEVIKSGSKAGELVHDIKKYGDMFESMPKKVKAYQEIKNAVDAEVMQKRTSKGGRELGMFAE